MKINRLFYTISELAAVVYGGTLPAGFVITRTVGSIAKLVTRIDSELPALIVIGNVVAFYNAERFNNISHTSDLSVQEECWL